MFARFHRLATIALLALPPLGATSAATPEAKNDKAEQKICRVETPTGSIRPVRICHTRAEWEAAGQQGQANKDQLNEDRMRQQQLQSSHG